MILWKIDVCQNRNPFSKQNMLPRHAFSTVELLVATSIGSVLTLGLSSAIFIAGKSLELPKQNAHTKASYGNECGRIRDAVSDAIALTQLSEEKISLVVPDRNADGLDEQIEYFFADNALFEQLNGGDKLTILDNIEDWEIDGTVREGTPQGNQQVSFVAASLISLKEQMRASIELPPGGIPGDFIVLIAATDEVTNTPTIAEAKWTLITSHAGTNGTLSAWYKRTETERETANLTWNTSCNIVCSALRFANVSASDPVEYKNAFADQGNPGGKTPWAPAVELQHPGGLVLQILAVNKNAIANQMHGLASHMVCQYGESGNLALVCSTYQAGEQTGIFDASKSFTFTRNGDYVAMGIGLAAAE